MEQKRTIAEVLKPTFENVTREFITHSIYEILFSKDNFNFKFDFQEKEALNYIEEILNQYAEKYDFNQKKSEKILNAIKQKTTGNRIIPVMIIKDYKKFFELLTKFYEKDIELYFKRTQCSGFPAWEMENCFKQIWLRATPEDFNDPEKFLQKQVEMINDSTFEKYNTEKFIGKVNTLDNHIICVKNGISRTWDETSRNFQTIIYDKKYYNNQNLFDRSHYSIPTINYGIYEKEGKKVCYIGSIQDKNLNRENDNIDKIVNRKKYLLNKNVLEAESDEYKNYVENKDKENEKEIYHPENISEVEPNKILALSVFIDFLNKEGITQIEIPSFYVLNYDYHRKSNIKVKKEFDKEWTIEKINNSPKEYQIAKKYISRNYGKEDLISEIKSERFIRIFNRILYHYSNGKIKSYPGELDSFYHMEFSIIKSRDEIKGDILKEIYDLVEERYESLDER